MGAKQVRPVLHRPSGVAVLAVFWIVLTAARAWGPVEPENVAEISPRWSRA